jgi:hypothetical protein
MIQLTYADAGSNKEVTKYEAAAAVRAQYHKKLRNVM